MDERPQLAHERPVPALLPPTFGNLLQLIQDKLPFLLHLTIPHAFSFFLSLGLFNDLLQRCHRNQDGKFRRSGVPESIFTAINDLITQLPDVKPIRDGVNSLLLSNYLDEISAISSTYDIFVRDLPMKQLAKTQLYPPFSKCPHCDTALRFEASLRVAHGISGAAVVVEFVGFCRISHCEGSKSRYHYNFIERFVNREKIQEWYTGTEAGFDFENGGNWSRIWIKATEMHIYQPKYIRVGSKFFEWSFMSYITLSYYCHKTSSKQISLVYNLFHGSDAQNPSYVPTFPLKNTDLSDTVIWRAWRSYKIYQFHLNRNIRWHRSSSMDANDVVNHFLAIHRRTLRFPNHICDVYGCGGPDNDGNLYTMPSADGVQKLTAVICAWNTNVTDDEKELRGGPMICYNQLPLGRNSGGRRFCPEHEEFCFDIFHFCMGCNDGFLLLFCSCAIMEHRCRNIILLGRNFDCNVFGFINSFRLFFSCTTFRDLCCRNEVWFEGSLMFATGPFVTSHCLRSFDGNNIKTTINSICHT
ncbi:hypothetical protein BKA69DRAFT_1061735 [Paraphysoderma sedebokerense]|nr:hypothetical protein BKA69DRAFT_1061735 [Paraphysoderma sedebokerense]